MTELRVYLPIKDLQAQFAAYLSTPIRGRGYPPREGQHSLIIEVAPALSIHRIADLAFKEAPEMEPGILFTERQFGLLELHSSNFDALEKVGNAILKGIGVKSTDQKSPKILFQDIIEDISDQHAIVLNRTRDASILVPGQSLLICEMAPALFACVAANEAERSAPTATLNDVQMIGESGRVFLSGRHEDMVLAQNSIAKIFEEIKSRIEKRQTA